MLARAVENDRDVQYVCEYECQCEMQGRSAVCSWQLGIALTVIPSKLSIQEIYIVATSHFL